jgi:hypothetical protein
MVSVMQDFASVLPDRIFVQMEAVPKIKFKSSVACGMHSQPAPNWNNVRTGSCKLLFAVDHG